MKRNIHYFVVIILVLSTLFSITASAADIQYTVASGDTLWKISQNFKVTIDSIKTSNNLTSDMIFIGQKLVIPAPGQGTIVYTVVSGDTLWIISQKYNTTITEIRTLNNLTTDMLYVGQKLLIPTSQVTGISLLKSNDSAVYTIAAGDTIWSISQKYNTTSSAIKYLNNLQSEYLTTGQLLTVTTPSNIYPYSISSSVTHIEYINYSVKRGDTFWNVGQQFKVPYQEIISANNLGGTAYLTPGQSIRIPVHIVPVKQIPGPKYGELLDWWTEAQYVFYTDSTAKVTDFYTGKTFYIKRTTGSNHADCEALTSNDTAIMKALWGGSWQWTDRPVIVEIGGRKLAASMAGMPHAGLDSYPALAIVNNRSGNYGTGQNLDFIKGNNMDGHFDLHFLNSTRHKDGTVDQNHQAKIRIAAGLQ